MADELNDEAGSRPLAAAHRAAAHIRRGPNAARQRMIVRRPSAAGGRRSPVGFPPWARGLPRDTGFGHGKPVRPDAAPCACRRPRALRRDRRGAGRVLLAVAAAAGPASGPGSAPAQPPGAEPGAAPAIRPPPAPRPVAARAASEEGILNRTLKLDGSLGQIRIERASRTELKARLVLTGTKLSNPAESCEVRIETPVPFAPAGRPDGLLRYEIAAPACPIAGDVVEGALFVRGPAEACRIEASIAGSIRAGCGARSPPPSRACSPTSSAIAAPPTRPCARTTRYLVQRAKPQDARAIVGEQAGFFAEREIACRAYARESAHGFCNAPSRKPAPRPSRQGSVWRRPSPHPPRGRWRR